MSLKSVFIDQDNAIGVVVKMAIDEWLLQNRRIYSLMNKFEPKELEEMKLPAGHNAMTAFEHIVASSDGLFLLLDLGTCLFPELEQMRDEHFISDGISPIKGRSIKKVFCQINENLHRSFLNLTNEEWLIPLHGFGEKNDEVSEWNRLKVLFRHTVHQSQHCGQLKSLL